MTATDQTQLEHVPCYYCGGTAGEVWGREAGYRAIKCASCGLVYVSPRPRLADVDEAAKTGQHHTEAGVLLATGRYRGGRVRKNRRLIKRTFGDFTRAADIRWLDIGAGFGELVKAVTEVFPAAEVVGIEPNSEKRLLAERHGVSLTDASLSELQPGTFDVASLMNVWSHLPDPAEFLNELRPMLAPGGRLLVQTGSGADCPSADAYPDALLLPDHLSFASERHVVGMLGRTGFRVEAVRCERIDTVSFALVRFAKRLLGRPSKVVFPYRSSFRTIIIRARAQR